MSDNDLLEIEPEVPEITFSDERVVIVGAGLSGLATAQSITELACARWRPVPRMHILEASDRVGGKIRTSEIDGFVCEWGPAGFLDREPMTLQLCRHLRIELLAAAEASRKRFLYVRGKLREVPMHPLRFVASPLLSWPAKLRLAVEPLARRPPAFSTDESVAAFGRRRIGDEAFRTLVDAMQSGIFAGDPERMSVASCFPRVVEVERDYGSLLWGMVRLLRARRRERRGRRRRDEPLPGAGPSGQLTSCPGGLQRLTDRLAEAFEGTIDCGAAVERIERAADGSYAVGAGGDRHHEADVVVSASPSFAAARILAPLDPDLAAAVREIPYAPMAVVCLGFERAAVAHPLDGFGFLAPRDQGMRPLGALFSSTIFPERAPPDHVLLRVMLGGARDPDILQIDDPSLADLAASEVGRALSISATPRMVQIYRHPAAIPQYNLGHASRLARIESCLHRHPGLFITGNAYRGIGVNDCVRNAWTVAEEVLWYLDQRAGRSY